MQCAFKIKNIQESNDTLTDVKVRIADAFGVDEDEVEIIEYMMSPM